jgi:hypothetical protein
MYTWNKNNIHYGTVLKKKANKTYFNEANNVFRDQIALNRFN